MTPKKFNSQLEALRSKNMFAARVVVPLARRLSGQSMPDQESLQVLLNDAMHEAIPVDTPARWVVVESVRKDLPEILQLAREWLLILATESFCEQEAKALREAQRRAAELAREAQRRAAELAREQERGTWTWERCPGCGFTHKWDSRKKMCLHCGFQSQ